MEKFTKSITDREKIPNQIDSSIEEFKNQLNRLSIGENNSPIEQVMKNIDYTLENIYYSKNNRFREFIELRKKKDATDEEISDFLEKDSNVLIS